MCFLPLQQDFYSKSRHASPPQNCSQIYAYGHVTKFLPVTIVHCSSLHANVTLCVMYAITRCTSDLLLYNTLTLSERSLNSRQRRMVQRTGSVPSSITLWVHTGGSVLRCEPCYTLSVTSLADSSSRLVTFRLQKEIYYAIH